MASARGNGGWAAGELVQAITAESGDSVVDGVALPLNAMAWPGLGDASQLGKLGVRRLSAGSGISQVLWGTAERLGRDFLNNGRSEPLSEVAMPYPQLQELFPAK